MTRIAKDLWILLNLVNTRISNTLGISNVHPDKQGASDFIALPRHLAQRNLRASSDEIMPPPVSPALPFRTPPLVLPLSGSFQLFLHRHLCLPFSSSCTIAFSTDHYSTLPLKLFSKFSWCIHNSWLKSALKTKASCSYSDHSTIGITVNKKKKNNTTTRAWIWTKAR